MLLTPKIPLRTPVAVAMQAYVVVCLLSLTNLVVAVPLANSPRAYGPTSSYGPPRVYSHYEREETPNAVVIIEPGNTDQGVVTGTLNIKRHNSGILITGYVTGLTPGKHGFHIHAKGLLTNNCKDAAGHFNPFMKTHGSPDAAHRHVGDLGNIVANDTGVARIYIMDSHGSLDPNSEAFIGDRGIVIHAGEDDLGLGGDEGSLKTGNAGGRVGCGTIAVQQNEPYRAPPPNRNQYQGYVYPGPLYDYPYHFPYGGYSLYGSSW